MKKKNVIVCIVGFLSGLFNAFLFVLFNNPELKRYNYNYISLNIILIGVISLSISLGFILAFIDKYIIQKYVVKILKKN